MAYHSRIVALHGNEHVIEPNYKAFTSSVYEHIHAALGGADGRTARGRFANGMEYGEAGRAGVVQFIVTIVGNGPNRGRSCRLRRNRNEAAAGAVAADLLVAYSQLADIQG